MNPILRLILGNSHLSSFVQSAIAAGVAALVHYLSGLDPAVAASINQPAVDAFTFGVAVSILNLVSNKVSNTNVKEVLQVVDKGLAASQANANSPSLPKPYVAPISSGAAKSGLVLLFLLPALLLSGCADSASIAATTLQNLPQLTSDVKNLVSDFSGDSPDYAQVIPTALNAAEIYDPNATVQVSQVETDIANSISSFTGGLAKTTGAKIAAKIVASLPANPTGAIVNAALTKFGIAASNGANPAP